MLSIMLTISMITHAQQEASNWHFGYGAGLQFTHGKPVFQKSSMNQWEGCASISDSKGKLLFYTNGAVAWNRQHKIMPNGKALKGHNSSTQSSVIVKKPRSSHLYYLFTVTSSGGKDGMQYSVVDMLAQEGLGDITEKNIPLLTPVCEKITAVYHHNKKDIWIITHKFNSDEYYAYLLTEDGISTQPVISPTGNTISDGQLNTIGYLKSSPNGTKLAAAHMTSFTELMDFDASSGRISNPIKLLHDTRSFAYGIEFSRNAELLYVTLMDHTNGTGGYNILQYRVGTNADSVNDSKYVVSKGNVGGAAGALQLGPDNKMYIAFNQKKFLGCILFPDQAGDACKFELEHISLAPAKSGLGLPSFMQSYLLHQPSSGYLIYGSVLLLLFLLLLFFIWRRRKKKKQSDSI